jgi:hypothetical protein
MPSRGHAARKAPFAGITDYEDSAAEIDGNDTADLAERLEARGRGADDCQIAARPLE